LAGRTGLSINFSGPGQAGLTHLKLFAGRAGLSKNVTGLDRAVKYRPVQTFNIYGSGVVVTSRRMSILVDGFYFYFCSVQNSALVVTVLTNE
jgi:hypothetical protein